MGFSILPKIRKDKAGQDSISTYETPTSANEVIFESIFEHHPDPVFALTLDGEVDLFNNSFLNTFGYTKTEAAANFKQFFFHQDIQDRFNLAVKGEVQSFHATVQHHDGHEIILNLSLVPLMDSERNVKGVYGSAKDITNFMQHHRDLECIKDKFEFAQQAGKIALWEYDVAKGESYWSKQLFEITGRDKTKSPATTIEEGLNFVYPADFKRYKQLLTRAELEGENYCIEYRILKADQSIVYVYEEVEVIVDDFGKPIKLIGSTQDITERKLAEKDLLEKEERSNHIYENLSLGIRSYDAVQDKVLFVTPGIELILGYSAELFYEKDALAKLIHPEDQTYYFEQYNNVVKGDSQGFEIKYRMIHKNSELVWVQDKTIPVLNERGEVIRIDGFLENITEQKKYEEKINQLAYYDLLTQLPNNLQFNQKIDRLIEQTEPFVVMFLDLDRFRNINNTLGHEMGDLLLKQFCNRINRLLPGSCLFARLGGDEFGLAIWGYGQSDHPESFAKKIIEHLTRPFQANEFELYLSASIGISEYPANGKTTTEILKNTSSALLRAKVNGKNNYYIYCSASSIASYKLLELEGDLRKSIANNELAIHFQPRIDANTGSLLSAEALIRWEHPVRGYVSPGEFIPIAEESGFINEITDWVLIETCRFITKWKEENLKVVPISINIPSQSLLRSDWDAFILSVLEQFNVEPSLIEFEITETTLFEHGKEIESSMQFLKDIGIKVALDDFGTGYSSLAHIGQFSVNTIKIDKSFVQQIGMDPKIEIIIKALLFMAKGMDMNTVAEGVETMEQLEFLKRQECKEIQGYLFSKAVTERNFAEILKKAILKPAWNKGTAQMENRRAFYRIDLLFPLSAQMTLTSFQGKDVSMGKTEIIIDNIGPGGIKFTSTIELPVRPDVIYQFDTTIMNCPHVLKGSIVWKNAVKDQFFEYGVEFSITEKDRDQLTGILNNFSLQLKNNPMVPHCDLITEDKFYYLRMEIRTA